MSDPDLSSARMGVLAALHEGDAGLAYTLVAKLMADGVPFGLLLDQLIAPIQAESGRRWQVGDYTISEEHASTAAAETLVATLAGAFDQPEDGTHVVVACAEGEVHSLPARMAAALLLAEGYRVTFLGTSVPAADLVEFLRDQRPDAVVLSCTLVTRLIGARASVRAAHDAGVPVIAGGLAFGSDDSRSARVGADAWAPTLRSLPSILEGWSPDPVDAESKVSHDLRAVDRLDDDRPLITRDATASLVASAGRDGQDLDRVAVRSDLEGLVDSLVTSTWLGEPALLADYARWLAQLLDARGLPGITPKALLGVLASAVGPEHREAADLLAGAIGLLGS